MDMFMMGDDMAARKVLSSALTCGNGIFPRVQDILRYRPQIQTEVISTPVGMSTPPSPVY